MGGKQPETVLSALRTWIESVHCDAWVDACSAAINRLDPDLSNEDARKLAALLWNEPGARTVHPDLMAQALWEQALILAEDDERG